LLFGICIILPAVCFALSTNFDTAPQDDKGGSAAPSYEKSYEESAPSAEPAPAPPAFDEKILKPNAVYIDTKPGTILIGNKLNLSKLPKKDYVVVKFDKKMIGRLPADVKAKVKLLENAQYTTDDFKSAVGPEIKMFNRLPYSKKIDFLYGNMQLSDVVNYSAADLDKIVATAKLKLGLGVGMAENIKKFRAAAGFTDNYIVNTLTLTAEQINDMSYITTDDIMAAAKTMKKMESDWTASSAWQRKKMLIGSIILTNVTKVY